MLGGFTFNPRSLHPDTAAAVGQMNVGPSNARILLLDDLISGLDADGIWPKIDVFWATAAHSEQAARLNLKNPIVDTLTAVNSPTFTVDRGFAGNGTSSYLIGQTDLDDFLNYQRNDAHGAFYTDTNLSANSTPDVGQFDSNIFVAGQGRDASGNGIFRINQSGNTGASFAVASSVGYLMGVRRGSTATEMYKDGVSIGTGSTASQAVVASPITLHRSGAVFSSRRVCLAHFGSQLSDTEAANAYSRVLTYLQGVGAA